MRDRMALLKVSRSLCLFAVCAVFLVTQAGAAQGDVRLVKGPNPYEGRVEYYNNGVWLGLCMDYIGSQVPMVICRQLGYPAIGAMMFYGLSYGTAPGEIFRGRISCSGNEPSLSGCSITNEDVNCNPVYTLGASCDTNITVSKTLRLRGGANPYEGRVEIFQKGIWGTVCRSEGDYYIYHQISAHVTCRELFGQRYGGSYFSAYETPSRFGILLSGAIHRYFVRCKGDEKNLLDCPYSTWNGCSHEQDATLKCYPVPQGCGGHLTSSSGTFQSPVYPAGTTFGQDTECVWSITVTEAYRVRLSVTIIETDGPARASNYLYVTDSSGYYIMTSTSAGNISSLVSSGNVMYVRLTTAANSTGIKFKASWDSTVPCDQNFTSTADSILSPGYPTAYPPNLDCSYFIQLRAEFKVKIQLYLFELDEKDNGICLDFLTVYDGDSRSAPILGGPYCGRTMPPVLTSTHNVVMIKFHSDANTSSTSRGFYVYYTGQEPELITQLASDFGTIQSPGYPNLYNNETDYIWNITASKPYKVIVLTFSDFIINDCNSTLQIRDLNVYGNTLASACGSGLLTPVTSTSHVIYMRLFSTPSSAQSGAKFNVSWTTECRQSFTGSSGSITSPEHPGPYPSNLDCTIIISQDPGYFIQLNFSSFQLDAALNGQCKDYIEVRDGSSENSNLIGGKYCGTSLPPSLSSTQNSMWIRFHSDGVTGANSLGFKAMYQSIEKKCEAQVMTAPEGNITSPGYPSYFSRNTYCIWTVIVDPGYVIELTFNALSVGQRSRECSYAYVRLYDSHTVDSDTVIDTFCGSGGMPKIATRRNSLTVVLNSFYLWPQTATGFHAYYKAIKKEGCQQGTYGMNCAHICNCSSGSDRCDVITGCVCKTGWAGDVCDVDVNECMTSSGQEACQRRNAECSNLLGGYTCVCRTGFAMDNDSNCQASMRSSTQTSTKTQPTSTYQEDTGDCHSVNGAAIAGGVVAGGVSLVVTVIVVFVLRRKMASSNAKTDRPHSRIEDIKTHSASLQTSSINHFAHEGTGTVNSTGGYTHNGVNNTGCNLQTSGDYVNLKLTSRKPNIHTPHPHIRDTLDPSANPLVHTATGTANSTGGSRNNGVSQVYDNSKAGKSDDGEIIVSAADLHTVYVNRPANTEYEIVDIPFGNLYTSAQDYVNLISTSQEGNSRSAEVHDLTGDSATRSMYESPQDGQGADVHTYSSLTSDVNLNATSKEGDARSVDGQAVPSGDNSTMYESLQIEQDADTQTYRSLNPYAA